MTPSTKPGQAQHVVGHALAPLAPGLGAGQRLAQAAVVSASRAGSAGGLGRRGEQLAVLVGPVVLQGGHQLGDLDQLAVDVLGAQVQLGRARPGVLVEAIARDGDHGVDRGLDRGLPLHGELAPEVLPAAHGGRRRR